MYTRIYSSVSLVSNGHIFLVTKIYYKNKYLFIFIKNYLYYLFKIFNNNYVPILFSLFVYQFFYH